MDDTPVTAARTAHPALASSAAASAGQPEGRSTPATATSPRRRRVTRRRMSPGGLDTPLEARRQMLPTPQVDPELFGRGSESFARFMGTARFIAYMTIFVGVWLAWNTFAPPHLQFDPRALNYTLLTLILSLQASYAAPLILLAQNRQADRDRVAFEQDRQRAERTMADTEYLAREVAALRIALGDVATRDFVRSELRDLLVDLLGSLDGDQGGPEGKPAKTGKAGKGSGKNRKPVPATAEEAAIPGPAGST